MRTRLAAVGAMLALGATPAHAHRLDEYLQATTIAVTKDRVQAQIRLTPGIAVFRSVLAEIDTDADGVLSSAEQSAYAERVLRDVSLTIDGVRVPLRLTASKFATIEAMREGLGDIELDVEALVPPGGGDRRLTFENRHERRMAVYLVNALVPRDPDVRIVAQNRSYEQAFYQLSYVQTGDAVGTQSLARWPGASGWFGVVAVLSLAQLAVLWRRSSTSRDDGSLR